jgi:hypothetical protein
LVVPIPTLLLSVVIVVPAVPTKIFPAVETPVVIDFANVPIQIHLD